VVVDVVTDVYTRGYDGEFGFEMAFDDGGL
jgi:hypothetical protein